MLNKTGASFKAANAFDKSMMTWHASVNTLDEDLKAKATIDARVYDLYRNDDLMRGLIERQIDTIVGPTVNLQALPDYEALGVTQAESMAWQSNTEREFHRYVDSPDNWISADRSMDFTQMLRAATRSYLLTGEIFASREWRQSPLIYNTCFALVSPDRVKSSSAVNQSRVYHGIEFDDYGAATAYHIEVAALNQKQAFGRREIKRYSRYNNFNWLQLYHIYEPLKPEYPRGISRLACVVKPLVQRAKYLESDLDKNIIATNYALVITSDEDPESVADMLSGANTVLNHDFAVSAGADLPPDVQAKRDDILSNITQPIVEMTGGGLLHLFKGEQASILQAPNATQSSADYAQGVTRNIANGAGSSYEIATGDFSGVNFSGGQLSAGLFDNYTSIVRRLYVYKLARLMYRTWMDEAMLKGTVPLLGGKEYFPNREAYTVCEFTGAKRVHVDPLKTARTNQLDLNNLLNSRTQIANSAGNDYDKIVMDRANEASVLLQATESVLSKHGLVLSDDARRKILVDAVSTGAVDISETLVLDDTGA